MLRSFETYQKNLWPVVGALARRGFTVAPDEAHDLIHDFYVDEWKRLGELYDPNRGPFERYLLRAFFQFARQRIARDYSRKKRVRELASTITDSDAEVPSAEEIVDSHSRTQLMQQALARLPPVQRKALRHFLKNPSANERDVARSMRMTRYRLRETLVDAVGRLAMEFDSIDRDDELEHQVAVALWRDGRTAAETATLLDKPVADVHVIRKRIVDHLLTALQTSARKTSRSENIMFRAGHDQDGFDATGGSGGSGPGISQLRVNGVLVSTSGGVSPGSEALILLKKALVTRDPELLQQLRRRATEVTAALDASDGAPFTEAESLTIAEDPQWLAQVYEALGGEEPEAPSREAEIEAAIDSLLRNQEREIAAAFQGTAYSLPEDLRLWHRWFGRLRQVTAEVLRELQHYWPEASRSSDIAELLRYGLTPASFFEAAMGLQLLLERSIRDSRSGTDTIVMLEFGHVTDHAMNVRSVNIPRQQLVAQIRSSPDCPPGAEESLLTWICLVAARHPLIFQGFKVLAAPGPVLAVVSDPQNTTPDIMRRWTYEPSGHEQMRFGATRVA